MKISEMIQRLERIKDSHGDLEVTCTHSTGQDGYNFKKGRVCEAFPDTFETTAETLAITTSKQDVYGEVHVRVWA